MSEPAEGILKRKSYSDAHSYLVECSCTSEDHAIDVWVEIEKEDDIEEVQVIFYMEWGYGYYPWKGLWHRVKTAWKVLWGGKVHVESDILLSADAARNFAEALEKSVTDLEQKVDKA